MARDGFSARVPPGLGPTRSGERRNEGENERSENEPHYSVPMDDQRKRNFTPKAMTDGSSMTLAVTGTPPANFP